LSQPVCASLEALSGFEELSSDHKLNILNLI